MKIKNRFKIVFLYALLSSGVWANSTTSSFKNAVSVNNACKIN